MKLWPAEDFQRLMKTYGSLTAPGAKSVGGIWKPITVKRGEKAVYSKQQKGGMLKSLSDMERLTEMRLMYLYMTLDMGMNQKIARSDMAKVYELSKSRIRDLVSVPKSKKPKK